MLQSSGTTPFWNEIPHYEAVYEDYPHEDILDVESLGRAPKFNSRVGEDGILKIFITTQRAVSFIHRNSLSCFSFLRTIPLSKILELLTTVTLTQAHQI
ncbi:hypothetical protein K1719_037994 [Acacia pycnantha]|nr:hypothetical protein K1719_037994 [Acacia pycnantha]